MSSFRLSVSLKLLLFMMIGLCAVVAFPTWLNLRSAEERDQHEAEQELDRLYQDFNEEIHVMEDSAASLAVGFADRPDVKTALINRDREALLVLLHPIFESLNTNYAITHLYLYEPNGRSLVAVHDPDTFGVFSDVRPMIRDAITSQQPVSGVEIDPNRLGVRGVAPIFDNGEFIGLVEVGLDYDQRLIDDLKTRREADYRLWVAYDAAALPGLWPTGRNDPSPSQTVFYYASTLSVNQFLPAAQYEDVLHHNRRYFEAVRWQGKSLVVLIAPMKGYGDQTIGVLEVIRSRDDALAALRQDQITTLTAAAGLILLGLVFLLLATNQVVLRPLRHLTGIAERQIQGDLSARVTQLPQDEFGQLGCILNSLTEQLNDLINTLEERVQARTRDLRIGADVSRQITTVLDPESLLREVVTLTRQGFDLYRCFVFLYDEDRGLLQGAIGCGEGDMVLTPADLGVLPLNRQPSIMTRAARTREAVLVNETQQSSDYMSHPLSSDTRSELAIPMLLGQRLLGVFDLQARVPNRFSQEDLRILKALAEQITIALRNTELFAQAKAARQQAEAADRAKSQFLASVSHELRTPLNGILNFTEFVAAGLAGPINEKQADLLNKATANGEHLLSLINDVLDISKIESESLVLHFEDNVNLKDELNTVIATGKSLLANKQVDLLVETDDVLPPMRGDRRRLRQVMHNLVANACKFTDKGSVIIRLKAEPGQIKFEVQDTGPGIPPEDQLVVFETFRQTETGLTKGQGTGLGLPISLRLVEAHGGRLWLESERGQGATFFVTLPLTPAPSHS
jgi:signal transduction histidine kinase